MPAIMVSDKLLRVLENFALGARLEAKLENLTRETLEHHLRACNEALSHFEAKYGLAFADFSRAWQEEKIPNKHFHEVERDFMEWEARRMEKEDLLAALRELRTDCKCMYPKLDSRLRGNDILWGLCFLMPAEAGIQEPVARWGKTNEICSSQPKPRL